MNKVIEPIQHSTAEAWLDAAYDLLTREGVASVKLMSLAKSLNVTRTSFYWHFKDREALLELMVEKWEEKNTGNLVERCEAYAETIGEAMLNLFDCWVDPMLFDARLDVAIRDWARSDPELAKRLLRADELRERAINNMFLRFDYSPIQAEVRAKTVFYTQIGYFAMDVQEDFDTRMVRIADYVEVFTGRPVRLQEVERFRARHIGRIA